MIKAVGEPRNYGPTEEERLELERIDMEKHMKKDALTKMELQRKEEEERKETKRRKEEWVSWIELLLVFTNYCFRLDTIIALQVNIQLAVR